MFFAHLARVVAFIVLLLGAFRAGMGFAIGSGFIAPAEAALARYGGAGATVGGMIDAGLLATAVAIAMGTLAEIALALRR